ncbi:MAG: hypothetical protein RLZZ46_1316 [Bacteroidota bacterium]|jgi:YVTN family beta-propeller protein
MDYSITTVRKKERAAILLALLFLLIGCRRDSHIWKQGIGEYPENVAKIIQAKCATPGCHTNVSKNAAAGLSLETWEDLFKGTVNGAAVIPFSPGQSTLFLFTNTFPELGASNKPTMPVNGDSLSKSEVEILLQWIKDGAPDQAGKIKFQDNPFRSKYYVVNQGCDLVTVFDADTRLPMRYVTVGHTEGFTESPHQIRLSPDGKYWYVIFLTGMYFQKYSTENDSLVAELPIGSGQWNTFQITSDSKYAFLVDYSSGEANTIGEGIVACVDLETFKIAGKYCCGIFNYPHAIALIPGKKQLMVFNQEGSQYYIIDFSASIKFPEISDSTMNGAQGKILKPHDIVFSEDGNEYYVSCQATDEVRIFDTESHKLLGIIPTGTFPQELALDPVNRLLYVTCMEDKNSFPGKRGSVYILDLSTRTVKSKVYTGHQPHGIAIDRSQGIAIVTNRNSASDGPAPHHTTSCGGRNGSVSFIDLNTLEFIRGSAVEVSVDPYFISIKP